MPSLHKMRTIRQALRRQANPAKMLDLKSLVEVINGSRTQIRDAAVVAMVGWMQMEMCGYPRAKAAVLTEVLTGTFNRPVVATKMFDHHSVKGLT